LVGLTDIWSFLQRLLLDPRTYHGIRAAHRHDL